MHIGHKKGLSMINLEHEIELELPDHIQKAWADVTIIDTELKDISNQLIFTFKPQRQIMLISLSLDHSDKPKNAIEHAIINCARAGEIV